MDQVVIDDPLAEILARTVAVVFLLDLDVLALALGTEGGVRGFSTDRARM